MQVTDPFKLPRTSKASWLNWPIKATEKITGLSKLSKLYKQYKSSNNTSAELFLDHALQTLNIKHEVVSGNLNTIPKKGPTLIVANHPLGGAEGLLLAKFLLNIRKDVKVLTNELLKRIPEFEDLFIGVDVFAEGKLRKQNMAGIKAAKQHLKQGGILLLFPAGEVSSLNIRKREITDIKWNRLTGYLCKQSQCAVVPIFIDAYNSKLFYIAGLIHPLIRTVLLPREMLRKNKDKVKLFIGKQITPTEYVNLDAKELTQQLRRQTYSLSNKVAQS